MGRAGRGGDWWRCGGSHCAAAQRLEVLAWGGDGEHEGGGGDPDPGEVQLLLGWYDGLGQLEKLGQKTFALKHTPSHLQAGQRTLKTKPKSRKKEKTQEINTFRA